MVTSSRNDQSERGLYRIGAITVDTAHNVASVHGQVLALAPKVVETLAVLLERRGELVGKDELMQRLWPVGFVEESNLTQNVYVLRRALAAHGLNDAIENVPRRGYRFTAPIEVVNGASAAPRAPTRMPWLAAVCAVAIALAMVSAFVPRSRPPHLSAESRRLYELGRYYWDLRTPAALDRAKRYFAAVIRRDPRSAMGYAGLADTYTEMYDYICDGGPCRDVITAAQRYARSAVQTDPRSAEAHTSLAMTLRLFAHDDTAAAAEFRRAIALDPTYAPAHQWYGNALLVRGDIRAARKELAIAAALQPVAPSTYAWLARDAYYSRRYSEAIQNAREALAITPNRFESIVILGLALQQEHRYAEAIQTFVRLGRMGVRCNAANGMIAGVYAAQGARSRALPLLAAQLRSCEPRRNVAMEQATALVALGDYSAALTWFKRLPPADAMQRAFLAMDPRLDRVRDDARFKLWTAIGR